ncbi:hypothetical protein C0992_002586 [Termitomyces sp. T32_za158]|nr:hypothetical protein C0992_002586 [Termitomyces sp. T32_za158]
MSSLTASTFVAKVDLFLARIKRLGVGALHAAAGVLGDAKHLGAEWLVPFEMLLIPLVPDHLLLEEMVDILGEEPMVVSGAASSGRQQLAVEIVSGKADLRWAAMEAEVEQVKAAVVAREQQDKRGEEKKAAHWVAAAQEGGDKGEAGTGDGAAAGAGASASAGTSGGAGTDAPGAGPGASGIGAGLRLRSLAIIGMQSKGASPSSSKRRLPVALRAWRHWSARVRLRHREWSGPRADVEAPLYKVPKQTTFSDDELCELLVSRRKEAKLDLGMAAGLVIDEAKGKMMVAPAQQRAYKTLKGVCDRCWGENNPEGCWFLAGVLPCLCCDSLKKPCTYDGLKSWERSKANKAVKRTFQKAILVWQACNFVEVQWVVKATGEAPVISDLSLALPMGQGGELVSTATEEEVKAPPSQRKDKGKGKAVAKGGNREKTKKREQPLTGDRGALRKRQALDEFSAGPSSHRDPSAAPSAGGQLEVMVPAPAWRPVQDWERQLVAARKAAEEDRAAKAKVEKEWEDEAKAKEKESEEKAAEAPPMGTPTPRVSVHQMPVPTPHVTTEDFAWLGEDLEYPVSAFASPSDLEALMARTATTEALIGRELTVVDTEMLELQAYRWNLFCSVEILRRY